MLPVRAAAAAAEEEEEEEELQLQRSPMAHARRGWRCSLSQWRAQPPLRRRLGPQQKLSMFLEAAPTLQRAAPVPGPRDCRMGSRDGERSSKPLGHWPQPEGHSVLGR
jgi:hypothetical protein